VLNGEATNTNFIDFGLTHAGLQPMIYGTTLEVTIITIIPPMWFVCLGHDHSIKIEFIVRPCYLFKE
jgi:hypothetical protein